MGLRDRFWGMVDSRIQQMGYVKASPGGGDITTLFAGEAPLHSVFESFQTADWERLAIASSWIYSDISLIAATFTGAQARVTEQVQDEPEPRVLPDHSFRRILLRPNPHMGSSHLWRYTLTWLLLRGEAYWWNVGDRGGELTQLWPIPADRISPIPDPKTYIRGYRYKYRDGSADEVLPPESVTFFRLPNPFDFHRGLSPLGACRLGLQTDLSSQTWNLNVVQKGAPLKAVISLPADLPKAPFDRFKADILAQFAEGAQFLIGRAGSMDVKAVGLNPKDLEFLAGREFNREELDRVFGVPAGFWAKEATRANSEAAEQVLVEKTVMPLHTLCAEQVSAQPLALYGDPALAVRFDDIRKEDRALVVQERRQNWQVLTVDEARGELGKDPLPDAILGGTLVPLATKQQAPGGFSPGGGLPVEEAAGLDEFKTDIRTWEDMNLRRFKRGEDLVLEFTSKAIPQHVQAVIQASLLSAASEEEIKDAYGYASLTGRDNRGVWTFYP